MRPGRLPIYSYALRAACRQPGRALAAWIVLLPVVLGGVLGTVAGALLFGGTFMGMVSLVLTMAGRYYPTRPAKMMGRMTISYGIAQILGPTVTGWLGATFGSYAGGLYVAATALGLAVLLLLLLKGVERRVVRAAGQRA